VRDAAAMRANLAALRARRGAGELVIDARPAARFRGEAPEPRAGLRAGHMPLSLSLPFCELLEGGRSRPPPQRAAAFAAAGLAAAGGERRRIVLTCGSGTTAAVLYAALVLAGRAEEELALYDGSWADWGRAEAAAENEVETGPAVPPPPPSEQCLQ
jgi:thiosulfate/3-mercaptopyruvate sulfurtransferase